MIFTEEVMHLIHNYWKVSCIKFDTRSATGSDTGTTTRTNTGSAIRTATGSAKSFAHEKKSD